MEYSTPIIKTKLYHPFVPQNLVPRPHLVEMLEKGRKRPLTLVVAPAGYGKTTLVAAWLETSEWHSAWISLDEEDSDLLLFLNYLLTAIETIFPQTCPKVTALLKASTLPPTQVLARTLISELSDTEENFFLVLDDYHLIKNMAVHDLLTEVLLHPPKAMHLVLVSRTDPALPLPTLRSKQKISDLRQEDLRFTNAETVKLLKHELDHPLQDESIQNLVKKTEGWITGLQLAMLWLRQLDDPDQQYPGPYQALH